MATHLLTKYGVIILPSSGNDYLTASGSTQDLAAIIAAAIAARGGMAIFRMRRMRGRG